MAGIISYTTYNFTNKDPVIDQMRTLFQDEAKARGVSVKQLRKKVHEDSGVSLTTFSGWFEGNTRRPINPTIMATALALGYDRRFVKLVNGNPYEKKGRKR